MNFFHTLAIDFESWIFAVRFQDIPPEKLKEMDNNYTPRVLDYMLKTLKKYNTKTTFFIVTRLEEMYPGIIEKIQKEGHEVGWHTHTHRRIDSLAILKGELKKAEKYIRKYKIKGFQAPEICIIKDGYKILKEAGFSYSSSIYGRADIIYNFDGILEIPVSSANDNYRPNKNEISFPGKMSLLGIIKYGLPYGSSFFWPILGKKYYSNKLSKGTINKKRVNLFIHDWQLLRPESDEYKRDVSFFRRPLFLPYKIDVPQMFEYFLKNFTFAPMVNIFK